MKTLKILLLILILSISLNSCTFTLPVLPESDTTTEYNTSAATEASAPITTEEALPSEEETTAQAEESTSEKTTEEAESETISRETESDIIESTSKMPFSSVTEQAESEAEKTQPTAEINTTEATKHEEEHTTKRASLCTLTIECRTVLNNTSSLKDEKKKYIPSDGIILSLTECEILEGDTVFSVLKRACENNSCDTDCSYCKKSGIPIEYNYTPAFNNYYIEGIHHLYEKDCGYLSGWMYSVNGAFPTTGMSTYEVKEGDRICILYTCDMGEDIGNSF